MSRGFAVMTGIDDAVVDKHRLSVLERLLTKEFLCGDAPPDCYYVKRLTRFGLRDETLLFSRLDRAYRYLRMVSERKVSFVRPDGKVGVLEKYYSILMGRRIMYGLGDDR